MSDQDLNPPVSTRFVRGLRRTGLLLAIAAVGLAAIGIAIRLRSETQVRRWTEQQAIPSVELIAPKAVSEGAELVLPGTLRAYIEAPIYARVSGYVRRWYVDIGAHVRAGQVLAEIETPELDQQIHQAEADLTTAQANEKLAAITTERWKNMLTSQSVSQQEADEKAGDYAARQAMRASAQANLERLRAVAAFKRVTAPFDGVVTSRNTDIGALINAGAGGGGQELFRVADEHATRVYVDVPQNQSAEIQLGLTAELRLTEKPDAHFTARVEDISQAVRESSRTMQVELLADNRSGLLLPGKYVEVHFHLPATAGLLEVPTTALLFRSEGLRVATVGADGHVKLRPIQLARERGAVVDVSSGLTAQDRIVDSPPDSIEDGELVRVATAPAGS